MDLTTRPLLAAAALTLVAATGCSSDPDPTASADEASEAQGSGSLSPLDQAFTELDEDGFSGLVVVETTASRTSPASVEPTVSPT